MSSNNVISLKLIRDQKHAEAQNYEYHARILAMDKLALLEEMVHFQEERSREGQLTREMIQRGKILFKALEEHAETQELKILSRSYRRHLEFELESMSKTST